MLKEYFQLGMLNMAVDVSEAECYEEGLSSDNPEAAGICAYGPTVEIEKTLEKSYEVDPYKRYHCGRIQWKGALYMFSLDVYKKKLIAKKVAGK